MQSLEMYEHGTSAFYHQGCRCNPCRAAASAEEDLRRFEYRQIRSEVKQLASTRADGVKLEHGNFQTYNRYGCRCRPCKDANAAYIRDYRARRERGEVVPCKGETRALRVRRKQSSAKLTAEQVTRIRFLSGLNVSGVTLAQMFDVTDDTIYNIVNGRTWKDVGSMEP